MLAAEKSVAVPHELMERLSDARRQSDALFNLVRENFLYEQFTKRKRFRVEECSS